MNVGFVDELVSSDYLLNPTQVWGRWYIYLVLILVLACALYERKRDQSFLVFFISIGPFIWFLDHDTWYLSKPHWHMTSKVERIFRSKKAFQNDEGAKQHMAPSTSQAAWTFVRVDWSPAATRKDIYDSWAIALPHEPSWGPKALAFTSTQSTSGVDMSAQYDEQQQPGMYPWATKLEAKLHFFNISSFIRLDFWESGFSFEIGGGHTPVPLSCCTTLLDKARSRA